MANFYGDGSFDSRTESRTKSVAVVQPVKDGKPLYIPDNPNVINLSQPDPSDTKVLNTGEYHKVTGARDS